jgi:hypothetical protein
MALAGVNEFSIDGVELCYVAKLNGNIPAGITGTISAGSGAGFRRVQGFTQLAETVPSVTFLPRIGDNGVNGSAIQKPLEPVTADFGLILLDQVTLAAFEGGTIYTDGAWEVTLHSLKCGVLGDMALIVSGQGQSRESGTVGQNGWWTKFYYRVNGKAVGRTLSGTSAEATETAYSLTMTEVDTAWDGNALATNYGYTFGYASTRFATYPILAYTGVGNGVATAFVLQAKPAAASADAVRVKVNGVVQSYTTHYTVNPGTKTVTFVSAPANNDAIYIEYEYIPSSC